LARIAAERVAVDRARPRVVRRERQPRLEVARRRLQLERARRRPRVVAPRIRLELLIPDPRRTGDGSGPARVLRIRRKRRAGAVEVGAGLRADLQRRAALLEAIGEPVVVRVEALVDREVAVVVDTVAALLVDAVRDAVVVGVGEVLVPRAVAIVVDAV